MILVCNVMGCEFGSPVACFTSRGKIYYHNGGVLCERHYLQASRAGRPDPGKLVWDFDRGYSGMFPQATTAEAAFAMLQRRRPA
jgi:hypothetical protein